MTADAVGGVFSYAEDLCRGLSAHGVEVLLVVLGGHPRADQRARIGAVPGVVLESSEQKLEWMDDPWDDVDASGAWLLSLARDFKPDIVHLNGYSHAALPWNRPVLAVGHSCVASWFEAVHRAPLPVRYGGSRRPTSWSRRARSWPTRSTDTTGRSAIFA
jgi:hypothetical protein